MSSIWDDPDFQAGGGEFVKFEKVGDGVSGHVTKIGRKQWDDGSVSPQLELIDDNGEPRTLTAGQVRLKAALAEHRPEVGDHLSVHLTEIIKRPGGKTLKAFDDIVVTKGGKTAVKAGTARPASPVSDEPPF